MAMTLRLTDDQERLLTQLAESQGVSKQEATVRAITEAAERRAHSAQVLSLSSTGRSRYAALLDRLAQ